MSVFTAGMDNPSDRIIDQRARNRIMEVVHILAEGEEGVRQVSPGEYFESFYDWIPHRDDDGMRPSSAITTQERAYLLEVSRMLDDACDATPRNMDADELIATGWPMRIQPVAQQALAFMLQRGRFSEEQEEVEPSSKGTWP